MKTDNIILIETMFLPARRKECYQLLETWRTAPRHFKVTALVDHVMFVQSICGKTIDPEWEELLEFIKEHRKVLLQRLQTIMVLAGEIKDGQVVA